MPLDTSIALKTQLPTLQNPIDAATSAAKLQDLLTTGQLNQVKVQDAQRTADKAAGLQSVLQTAPAGTTPDQLSSLLRSRGYYDEADKNDAAALKRTQVTADANKANADAGATNLSTGLKKLDAVNAGISSLAARVAQGQQLTHDDVYAQIASTAAQAGLTPEEQSNFAQAIPQDPRRIPDFIYSKGLEGMQAAERLKAALPNNVYQKTGGTDVPVDMNPLTNGGKLPTLTMTQTPDSVATNATSRANNAATIAKDYKVAGLDGQGNFTGGGDGGQFGGLIDAIGQGKVPESTALGRVPPGVKSQVLQAVMAKYPDYDPTTIATRKAANVAFTSGQQGNAMRSSAVAVSHMAALRPLIDALDNGSFPLINQVANAYKEQTGDPAPTNFDAAKAVVSKEVLKAMIGSGSGGVEERLALEKALANAKGPKALNGVLDQYSTLMSAQHDALLEQRRAAGLPDSTLPNYSQPKPATAATPTSSGPPVPVKGDNDYNALPSGTRFQAPDGSIRVKP